MAILRDIVDQAVSSTASDPDCGLDADELYRLLDVRGTRNEHLANPLNLDSNVHYFRARENRLSGSETVFGDFLTLHYCGHDPAALLLDHDNRSALEESILSGGGILNPFTTFLIAFIDFGVAPYCVTYLDHSGVRIAFDKQGQNNGSIGPGRKFPDAKISW